MNRFQIQQTIAITATFTAEPISEFLDFWMRELNLPSSIAFAPYNQVFQQLLNPESLLAQNQQGVNLVLLRFEDWQPESTSEEAITSIDTKFIERTLQDFLLALKSAAKQSAIPYLVYVCPSSPTLLEDPQWLAFSQDMEALMLAELEGSTNIYWARPAEIMADYPVETYYDAAADRLGHIPYTPLFFSALGTAIARKIHVLKSSPHKVLVLDCDNTLWKGVCGEDGAFGIEISPPFQALQEFVIAQHRAGMLICLNSKNSEADVEEVFRQRLDMPLKRDHIVSWRINWEPKSKNLRALAQELQLGLDSFIFVDDNPVECAEVQANCPEVLTLHLPEAPDEIPTFLSHIWAFDRLKVTVEDQQRTELYKRNLERERLRQTAPTLQDFLAELKLEIKISPLTHQTISRVSQLTQRTNQFNLTTVRRSEGEIQELYQSDTSKCLVVEVSDRFGNYGLVGVMIFGIASNAIRVDTFLLSCRVLGRGVEHYMLSHLAEIAQKQGISQIDVPFLPTAKNQPALNFLQHVGGAFKQSLTEGFLFCFPTDFALNLTYTPASDASETTSQEAEKKASKPTAAEFNGAESVVKPSKSQQLNRIAKELCSAEQVLRAIERQYRQHLDSAPQIAPQTELEHQLAELWAKLLRMDAVSIRDNFFDLGGTSLLAVQLFSQIEQIFGKTLPLTTLLEAPTVEQLAGKLQQTEELAPWTPLIPIQVGGTKPPLFCPQGAGGNVIVYRRLAQYLGEDQPVYGLQARGLDGKEDPYTWIEEMAADYLRYMRSVQPQGPYFLAGLSSGGRVAFEMAQQLHAQGEAVGLVVMFDTYGPGFPKLLPPVPRFLSLLQFTLQRFMKLSLEEKRNLIEKKLRFKKKFSQPIAESLSHSSTDMPSSQPRRSLRSVDIEPQGKGSAMERWMNRISLKLMQSTPWAFLLDWHIPGATEPLPIALQKVQEANIQATLAYQPKVYPGSVTLFRCSSQPAGYYADPNQGWAGLAAGGLQVYEVDGSHHSMLQDPFVAAIAKQLKACLEQAQQSIEALDCDCTL